MTETIEVIDLFRSALELSERDQARLLEGEERRDPERALELRVLLGLHEDLQRSSFLHSPLRPDGRPTEAQPGSEAATPDIGSYRILEPIARGGMALIYLAEQRDPIWRRVAIKVLRQGIDNPEALARFQLERQALALMDHPNVAKVLDTGATVRGRPYFVLEYIPGETITAFCWRHRLPLAERLRLFIQVCAAIEHAHQKGIIHRDVKPSNILVTGDGPTASVRVIDFGIAKTISRLIADTPHTRHGQLIGTPEYMSPEQIEFDGPNVDTRTDLYSLGILLYEMLTGVSPFAARRDHDTLSQVRDAVLFEEPPKPSLAAETDNLRRQDAVPVPSRQLRGDLDWILLKALAKDRSRRYGTARELAQDIERHLHDDPVSAGPPSVSYRMTKFVRRHRSVSLVGAILLFLGIALGISTAMMLGRLKREGSETLSIHREILRHVGSPIMTFDGTTHRFVEVNSAALDLFGYTKQEFLDLTVFDISGEPEKTVRTVPAIFEGKITRIPDRIFVRKDGSRFHAEILAAKYSWESGVMGVGLVVPFETEPAAAGSRVTIGVDP